jgi:hypothetical protein
MSNTKHKSYEINQEEEKNTYNTPKFLILDCY